MDLVSLIAEIVVPVACTFLSLVLAMLFRPQSETKSIQYVAWTIAATLPIIDGLFFQTIETWQ